MAAPKSVTKVYRSGAKAGTVEFTSSVDRVNYTLEELTKAALRDVGKVIVPKIKDATPKKSGRLQNAWQKWVKKDKTDGHMELDLGVYSKAQAKKKGKDYVFYAQYILMGFTTKDGRWVSGNNFLQQTVEDNISLIRDTEAQYLSAIEDEQNAIKIATEEEGKAEDA